MIVEQNFQTKPLLNAHLKNPSANLTDIEVTDVMHPLFGRRFAVISISTPPSGEGHAVVAYRGHMRLRIPLSATQLALPKQYLRTKLTLESVTELVTLAKQCEVLCQSHPVRSGNASPQHSKK
ncbi:hypothetical protein [Fischerella sp. PCC 9605]|uniref:hypothetical protein n=1 Tax=Fischerella sp. PCC 9605 TaxID=1173024 RepID=UPI0018CBF24B|nr:hypothetical protein [Fischerella sp. PCC 9605]